MHFIPMQYPVYLYFIIYFHVNFRHLSPLLICHSYHCCIYQYNHHYYYYHYSWSFYIPYSTVSLLNSNLLPIFGFILPQFVSIILDIYHFILALCVLGWTCTASMLHTSFWNLGDVKIPKTQRSAGGRGGGWRVGGGGSDTADHHPTPLFRRVVVVVPRVVSSPPPR